MATVQSDMLWLVPRVDNICADIELIFVFILFTFKFNFFVYVCMHVHVPGLQA